MAIRLRHILHSRWLAFLLTGIILIIGTLLVILAVTGHWINPFVKKLEFHITAQSTTVSKDRFLELDGELRNHTTRSYGAAWNTCAQQIDYFLDGKKLNTSSGVMCAIGYGDIGPGEVFRQAFRVNPSEFSIGEHSFYMEYDGLNSNTLNLTVTNPTATPDCYNVTGYTSPLCSQIRITAGVSDLHGDDIRCRMYLDYLSKNTPLKPITPLSSVDCVEKDSAVPYIVVNVPKGDPDQWVAKLSDHFSYTALPNDYALISLVTYPPESEGF